MSPAASIACHSAVTPALWSGSVVRMNRSNEMQSFSSIALKWATISST
jgi:hypothetical protein